MNEVAQVEDRRSRTRGRVFDFVPTAPRWQEYVIRTMAVAALLFGTYWIAWRWTQSLNPHALIFSLALVLAETWGLLASYMLVFTVWKLKHNRPDPAPEGLAVDVYITCYNEPLEVIRRTAIGARAISYPHQTYILDDGKRDEVKAMAESLGVQYLRREGNEHAKAGNLNHALKNTTGDFFLQLDADHVPMPHMLDQLVGYFNDPDIAFVQSPQDFYNTDSFTHVIDDEGRRLWEENRIFFSLIQPGKDSHNAAFFCGSCGVLRRSAIEEIGGFSTLTVTEDMETSIVLHSRGWKSLYHGETLAYGLAPVSADAYHTQRLRWGQGAMQILRKMNPLTYPGLSFAQRIQYFDSVSTYVAGLQKIIFYLAPVLFFAFGWLPVRLANRDLLIRLVPYITLTIVSFELLSRGTGWILISERYNMAKFWTYIIAIPAFFTTKPLGFMVTPKGASGVRVGTYAPQLILGVVSALSLIWATAAHHYGWINYHSSGWSSISFRVNGFWVLWNIYFAAFVVRHSRRSVQHREDHRFLDTLPIQVSLLSSRGEPLGETALALTQELNPFGLSFRSSIEYPAGARVRIPLPLASETVEVTGTVMHAEKMKPRQTHLFVHGVKFDELSLEVRDAIELHCTHHALPMWRMTHRQSLNLFNRAVEVIGNIRGERRVLVQLPARITVSPPDTEEKEERIGLLEDVSKNGARLLLAVPVPPGSNVSYEVPGTSYSGAGTAVFNRALESPMNTRFVVGVAKPKISRLMNLRWRRQSVPASLRA